MSKPKARPDRAPDPPRRQDSKGRVRIIADIPHHLSVELSILALRAGKSKRDLICDLIEEKVKQGQTA